MADDGREAPRARSSAAARCTRKREQIGLDLDALGAHVAPDVADVFEAARDDDIGDDLLRLVFTACHPVLSTDARVALTLRLLGG